MKKREIFEEVRERKNRFGLQSRLVLFVTIEIEICVLVALGLDALLDRFVPLPFEIYATIQTVKYNDVEKHVHKTIDRLTDLRIRQNREFFNVPPQIALDIFNDIAKMIDDAVVTVYVDNKPICHNEKDSLPVVQKRTVKRGRFKFSMVGIK